MPGTSDLSKTMDNRNPKYLNPNLFINTTKRETENTNRSISNDWSLDSPMKINGLTEEKTHESNEKLDE